MKVVYVPDKSELNRVMDEFQSSLPQKRGEIAYMNQEPRMLQGPVPMNYYNTDYSYPNINWYSVNVSYTPMDDYWDKNWPR
jgi:hypothetical protein